MINSLQFKTREAAMTTSLDFHSLLLSRDLLFWSLSFVSWALDWILCSQGIVKQKKVIENSKSRDRMYQVEMQLYRDHLIERFKRRNSVKMSPPPPGYV